MFTYRNDSAQAIQHFLLMPAIEQLLDLSGGEGPRRPSRTGIASGFEGQVAGCVGIVCQWEVPANAFHCVRSDQIWPFSPVSSIELMRDTDSIATTLGKEYFRATASNPPVVPSSTMHAGCCAVGQREVGKSQRRSAG